MDNKRVGFIILFSLLISSLFLLYNYILLTTQGRYAHIDTGEILLLSRAAYEDGHFWINEPLNAMFEYDVFTRQASVAIGVNKTRIVPWRDLGIYILATSSNLLGRIGPFLVTSMFGVMGAFFIYLLTEKLFGNKLISVCAFILYGFSPPVIYWSNFLLSNIPALSFFIGSLYFIFAALKEGKISSYLMSGLSMSSAIWLRYEYVVVALLFLAFLYFLREKINFRYLVITISLCLLLLLPILFLNNSIYGDPFTIGYLHIPGESSGSILVIPRLDARILFINLRNEILSKFPLLSIIGIIGAILYVVKYKDIYKIRDALVLYLTLSALFFFYRFGNSASYGGFGEGIMISSYDRYFLIIFLALEIFGALTIVFFSEYLFAAIDKSKFRVKQLPQNKIVKITILFILIAYVSCSVYYVFTTPYGLTWARNVSQEWGKIDEAADKLLPEEAIVLTDFYSPYILSRRVFWSHRVSLLEWKSVLPLYVLRIIEAGYPIYLIERESLLKQMLESDDKLQIIKVNDRPEIYQIIAK